MGALDDKGRKETDAALLAWRQGDCVIGEHWFLFRTDITRPLTSDGAAAAAEGVDSAEAEVVGFMITTQTCDIVRGCDKRPFIEVSPLVEVEESTLRLIERGHQPGYAFIAGLAGQRLVADLDRVMTVEKSVVASWERLQGCQTDHDARRLSLALARKRARFAFPDAFVHLASSLQDRLSSKHDKESDEGRALRARREVRVRAAPSWEADEVRLTFWFIRDEDALQFEGTGWDHHLQAWMARVPASGRFKEVDGLVLTLEDLTARDYVESDPLDLDHLSNREA